jgi:hypothetical protein
MELHEMPERWAKQLEVAETFLPDEPMAAFDQTRAIVREIERFIQEVPDTRRGELSLLLTRARASLARSQEASSRWLASAAERGRRHQRRELEAVGQPMRAMRNPWPPHVSG